jgi:trans-2,3-dihydro-3-hydroxyanthranilate isomerase
MREIDVYQVDAFTDVLFGGNPAGVVPDAGGLSEDTMQKIAREMNLSETAFVVDTRGKGTADFDVRFFTPLSEVDLCGHATIGAFWLLAEMGRIPPGEDEIRTTQSTKAGILPVDVAFGCEGTPSRVMMTQVPPMFLGEATADEIAELEVMLGAPKGCIMEFGRARPQVVSTGLPDLITPVSSREALLSMRPNMAALTDFCNERKIISVHCFSMETIDPRATVHCRDFSPAVGVPEESATGTASGATGGYLVRNGLVSPADPVTRITCEQGHILRRPSTIHVEVTLANSHDPSSITSVRVGGSAVTILTGKMKTP